MQKAEIVLSMLGQKSSAKENHGYVFDRLYRNLFNQDFYVYAYAKLFPKLKCLLKNHQNFEPAVKSIIEKIKKETFYPQPVFKNSGLCNCSFEDKLVKAVLSSILETLYFKKPPGYFSDKLLNAHKILSQIQATCQNKDWAITSSIENFAGSNIIGLDYEVTNKLLAGKITDGRFLELIRRFLIAGHLNCRLGDVIAAIYLNEFDLFIDKLKAQAGNSVNFFRHLNEFIIFTSQGETHAQFIFKKICSHLKINLKLSLNQEKTAITHLPSARVDFLEYQITKKHKNYFSAKNTIRLLVPNKVITKKLKPLSKNNKPVPYFARVNLPVAKIIGLYNNEIKQLHDYYSLAADASQKIGKFRFYHYYSLAKTIACKEKISVRKVMEKYGIKVKIKTKNGSKIKKIIGIKDELKKKPLTYFLPEPPLTP